MRQERSRYKRIGVAWLAGDYGVILLALTAGGVVFFHHATVASDKTKKLRNRQDVIGLFQESILSRTKDLTAARKNMEEARKTLEKEKQESDAVSSQLEDALHKCENLRAQLEAEKERTLMEKGFDWKEQAYNSMRAQEQSLVQQKAEWEARLGPLRKEMQSLRGQVQSHRIELAKTEVFRVMNRVLGKVTEDEASAFFHRISSLTYQEPFTLTRAVASRLNAHKGLWTVTARGEKRVLGMVSDQLMGELPDEDVIGSQTPRGGKWPSCAVVGNSGLLTRYRQGREIDLHDAIWRLDDAPVDGFQEHVGSHTTVRVVSDGAHAAARMRPSRETVLQLIDTKETLEEFVRFKTEQRRDAINVHLLSPEFSHHLSKFMLRNAPQGFYTLALAMHKCRSIDVYGFAPSWGNSIAYRYWDDFEPEFDVRRQQGPMRDPEGTDFMLVAELARHGGRVRTGIHEPCLTAFASYEACAHDDDGSAVGESVCGVMQLSESATCVPDTPLPQPRPGFCSDSPRKRVPANCFRRCPGHPGTTGDEQCRGDGRVGPACEAVGVSPEQGTLVGVTCPGAA
uniref:Beta-galactoside alpha--sialyltransferase 2 n=2 Tax=Tetraselmis sp. GSL018 TaxID=582737 RepID=A0A061SAY5_9CHLO